MGRRIDSISTFDLLTQRRDSPLEKIHLSPAREVLFGDTAQTAEALREAQKKARGKRRTALEQAMAADLAQLDAGQMPEAMDKYYGLRYPAPATLLEHLDSPVLVLDEVGGIRDAQKATEYRRGEEITGLLEEGVLCPGLDVFYQTMTDLSLAAQQHSTLLCENFLRGMNEFRLKDTDQRRRPQRPQLGRRIGLPAGGPGPAAGPGLRCGPVCRHPQGRCRPDAGSWPIRATL